jgi:hypothetical protein
MLDDCTKHVHDPSGYSGRKGNDISIRCVAITFAMWRTKVKKLATTTTDLPGL